MTRSETRPLSACYVEAGGYHWHARSSPGPASPEADVQIVLVHGLIISSRYMVPTAERLAPHLPVHAVDLPGFGKSGRPHTVLDMPGLARALGAWIEAMDLRRAVLVGNSLGCQVSAYLGAWKHSRVAGLVLAGPTMDPAAGSLRQITRWLRDIPRERWSIAVPHVLDYLGTGPRRIVGTIGYALADRIEEQLLHVEVPTLVVRGSRDPVVPERWAEEATRLLPNGRLVVVPGSPHAVNYSKPRELARLVRAFARML
jgi:2-hydroxy-6-oxonona-2,4-dienedioate hydrolase